MKEKRILIVDDNEDDRLIIQRVLRKTGYRNLLFAKEGQEGIEKAQREKPDVAIIDTILPGIDGFEVCRQIRAVRDLAFLKIIMMTGSIDAVDGVKAKRMGADDYCVKTSDFLSLIETVKRFIPLQNEVL